MSLALAVGVSVVILLSLVRGLARGFVAISDDAQIALRARDVLTEHHPLVGMASSGSVPGNEFNHPGPMLFDLLAVPVRLLGDGVGVAVGATLINLVAVWGIVLTARRVAGEAAAVVVAAGICALCWAMGSEVLYSVWNPNVVVLAFVWLCVASWAVACGLWRHLPVAVFLGSLCAQSQLGYPIVVAAVLMAAIAIGWWWPAQPVVSSQRTRSILLGAGVLLACWAQPLWEQFMSDGRGNISRTISAGSETEAPVGFEFGLRILADVLAPTSWFRPEFDTVWFGDPDPNVPGLLLSVVVLIITGSVTGWAAMRASRDSPPTVRLLTIVGALFLGGMATLVRLPAQFGVAMSAYNVRWIWPGVVLLLVALILALWPAGSSSWLRGRAIGACAVGVLLLVLAVPTHGLATRRPYLEAVSEMRAQVTRNAERVTGDAPLRMRFDTLGWTLPYPYVVAAALDEQGVDIVVREPFMIRQYGPRRATQRDIGTVWVQTGDGSQAAPRGAIRLAHVPDTPDGPLTVYADA